MHDDLAVAYRPIGGRTVVPGLRRPSCGQRHATNSLEYGFYPGEVVARVQKLDDSLDVAL
jgi:hypothetical protein